MAEKLDKEIKEIAAAIIEAAKDMMNGLMKNIKRLYLIILNY